MRKRKGERLLRPVWPNAGIRAAYDRKLRAMVRAMSDSYLYWLRARYRANEPAMARDATPASELERELKDLFERWHGRFDEAAPNLAEWFAKSSKARSDAVLKGILRDAGITVRFMQTPEMRDVFDATVAENVGLIRSIPEQYHTQVQSMVMQSVKAGRDLGHLSAELEKRYGITARRAALVSLDQNNKATSAMMAARQTGLGIEEGVWLHSHAGKEPRPTHVANHGKRFDIKEGWHDPDPKVNRRILPGELINCRCTWRPVVKGFS